MRVHTQMVIDIEPFFIMFGKSVIGPYWLLVLAFEDDPTGHMRGEGTTFIPIKWILRGLKEGPSSAWARTT